LFGPPSTIRDCDAIIVLEQGHIAERGTLDELWTANGLYRKLLLYPDAPAASQS